ncbi:prophage LambdaSo, transcriptional regulator, Cro/CI family [Haemophilus influenzae HK1212]|uniref:Prophage LambdaSo, transcriptional regulator, Cro/CI family n=2 Tax=Haemophilus influenzae HK1212 TaxID=456482 RepID=A0A7G2K117_HAEIF|nr:prophage LambdaSo, transcriptional regulator, Cro/CI family [Haemophilus influenzae HK1212]
MEEKKYAVTLEFKVGVTDDDLTFNVNTEYHQEVTVLYVKDAMTCLMFKLPEIVRAGWIAFEGMDANVKNGFEHKIKLRFSKATLRKQGVQYENAVCVIADGNSMEPVIPDGTTVGIDLGNKTIRDGKIYAINHGGLLRIKLLYNMPNEQVKIRSYNTEEHPDEIAELQDISVLGKVFWYSVLL